MITQDTFPQLLRHLGFTKGKTIFMKEIGPAMLIVDMENQEIQYPETVGFVIGVAPNLPDTVLTYLDVP